MDYCDVFIRLSFWRHPFTAEHRLLRHWCNATFLQIWWRNKLIHTLDGLKVSTFSLYLSKSWDIKAISFVICISWGLCSVLQCYNNPQTHVLLSVSPPSGLILTHSTGPWGQIELLFIWLCWSYSHYLLYLVSLSWAAACSSIKLTQRHAFTSPAQETDLIHIRASYKHTLV